LLAANFETGDMKEEKGMGDYWVIPSVEGVKCSRLGRPGALGILEGLVPAGRGVGIKLVAAEGALAMMDEMGTAVGFCDAKEKEGVGNKVPETLATEEAAEAPEATEVPEVTVVPAAVAPDGPGPIRACTASGCASPRR